MSESSSLHPTLHVLMACYNRREKTVRSLESLLEAHRHAPSLRLQVTLFDDGSTDGTAEAVRAVYPDITILQGDGSAFWNGGMYRAFQHAAQQDPDFFLWLNDDTFLYPEALNILFETYRVAQHARGEQVVVVGAVQEPESGELSYGAQRRGKLNPMRFSMVTPHDPSLWADTMHGNCVLIPRAVVAQVGISDPKFKHAMGDIDYGLRVQQAGGFIRSTAVYVGTCTTNPTQGTWLDTSLPLKERLAKLDGIKGLPRDDWSHLLRRHGGPLWYAWMMSPRVKVILQGLLQNAKKGGSRKGA